MGRYYTKLRSAAANETASAWKYSLACPAALCTNLDAAVIEKQRVLWARHRDEMLVFQKQCGATKDIEGAKFFKEESRHALKMYRAACMLLPWYANEWPGDCKFVDPYEWPEELFDALDYIYGMASLPADEIVHG